MHDNIYFLSWSDVSNPVVAATLAADGSIINGYIVIPVVSGGNPEGLVFNVFGINPAEYFIVWHTADHITAFYNIFIIDPPIPTQFTGKKRLNRFINYGEYFVNLFWQPSISLYLQSYKIYRNGAFIARISPLATFISLHNQPRQGNVYGVQAVNSFGGTNTAQVLI